MGRDHLLAQIEELRTRVEQHEATIRFQAHTLCGLREELKERMEELTKLRQERHAC